MYKYAEVYGGKVRDLKESNLEYIDFCSIWDPTFYWIDVTSIEDIQIGYLVKFSQDVGTYFEKPADLPDQSFEAKQKAKLELLNYYFEQASENAYIDSSLGFRADADQTAYRDIDGLINILSGNPETKIQFCDYDNLMQELNLSQLQLLQKEVAQNGTYLYQQKWAYRDLIESSETEEDLNDITFDFKNMSFSSEE